MQIPQHLITPSLTPVERLADVDAASRTLAVFGTAPDLERLSSFRQLESLWIKGLRPTFVDVLVTLPVEKLVVRDWRLEDLSPLKRMTQLKSLGIADSSKLRNVDGLESLTELHELSLFGNCNFDDIGPVGMLRKLRTLCLEGGFSKKLKLTTVAPLRGLAQLENLRLASIRVKDGSLEPIRALPNLRSIFIDRTLPKRELEAVAAAHPAAFR